jgi:nucleoid-associated protein YgaU
VSRQHGQTTYFIEGEGFVGEQEIRQGSDPTARALRADTQPEAQLDPNRAFRFSRMFPDLKKFRPDPEGLIALGKAMQETPNVTDHPTVPAGFTYLGQFLDHDITFDKTDGLPSTRLNAEEIAQGRSPSLDLDSVYGRGPAQETKRIYEDDKIRFRIGTASPAGPPNEPEGLELPNDLPRGDNPAKPVEATIGDPRNDENLAVAQTHLAFLKFHNVVAAMLAETGLSGNDLFERARRTVTLHYQWIVLHDFLPRVTDPLVLADVLNGGRKFFQITPGEEPTMPIEFSVAAYRFGHSMIRDTYSWNRNFEPAGLDLLFAFSGVSGGPDGGMFGGPVLPSNWPIDWRRFYDCSSALDVEPTPFLNTTRRIDTALALDLGILPEHGGAEAGDKASLAVRNLLRGRLLGLPTGQAVAEALGAPVMTAEQVRKGPHASILKAHGFDRQTPLWYYILKEAEVLHDGLHLGPVGSRLLAETFVGLIEGSRNSVLAAGRYWRPTLPSLRPGHFTMVDLLLLVNDLNPLGSQRSIDPAPQPEPTIHVVQPGDTLRSIAAMFLGEENRWREIFDANRDQLQNPNRIRVGQRLVIPVVADP